MTFTRNGRGQPPIGVRFQIQSNCLILFKKMGKDIHKTGEPKARYRIRNLAAYNEVLINRWERDDMDK
ncbi:MAG: hypothetical protein E5299_01034 [Burkholderia gladioli]|nr:MAG: hypothetical protein E5299_01034 [Burkholderia gladioli]